MLGQPLDRTVLACTISAFNDHEHARAIGKEVALKLYELDLQRVERLVIMFVAVVRIVIVTHGILLALDKSAVAV
jgi:hypothetical protein